MFFFLLVNILTWASTGATSDRTKIFINKWQWIVCHGYYRSVYRRHGTQNSAACSASLFSNCLHEVMFNVKKLWFEAKWK